MYKHTLQKSSKKNICPNCGKKCFVPYINNETKEIIHHSVGRCDREVNCRYHLTPSQYFKENKISFNNNIKPINIPKQKQSFLPSSYIKKSFKTTDNFTKYLQTIFTSHEVKQVTEMYKIGASTYWKNSTIFWQIDNQYKVRTGKVILYDNTGHRSKYATWIHSILLKKKVITTYHLNQCLFGLHLINTNSKPIAIVESEKTACIMSIKFPKYLWLATGGSNNIADKYFIPLKKRKIILFPDLSIDSIIFDKWNQKALELKKFGFNISTSTLLEVISTGEDRQKGLDIADYYVLPSFSKSAIIKQKEDNQMVPCSLTTRRSPQKERLSPNQILSIPQQTLLKLINKNSEVEKLINAFDLELNNSQIHQVERDKYHYPYLSKI